MENERALRDIFELVDKKQEEKRMKWQREEEERRRRKEERREMMKDKNVRFAASAGVE